MRLDLQHAARIASGMDWEPWKALAAIIAAAAVFAGGVLTVAAWWHPSPQTINVYVEAKE